MKFRKGLNTSDMVGEVWLFTEWVKHFKEDEDPRFKEVLDAQSYVLCSKKFWAESILRKLLEIKNLDELTYLSIITYWGDDLTEVVKVYRGESKEES